MKEQCIVFTVKAMGAAGLQGASKSSFLSVLLRHSEQSAASPHNAQFTQLEISGQVGADFLCGNTRDTTINTEGGAGLRQHS
eukprot:229627-Pelagomonas_calceolata.AAC.2